MLVRDAAFALISRCHGGSKPCAELFVSFAFAPAPQTTAWGVSR